MHVLGCPFVACLPFSTSFHQPSIGKVFAMHPERLGQEHFCNLESVSRATVYLLQRFACMMDRWFILVLQLGSVALRTCTDVPASPRYLFLIVRHTDTTAALCCLQWTFVLCRGVIQHLRAFLACYGDFMERAVLWKLTSLWVNVWGYGDFSFCRGNILGHRCENEPWSCMEDFCMLVAATIV